MCWVATGAESVYNLSPTGFEIYLYQTDGEGGDTLTTKTAFSNMDTIFVYPLMKDWTEITPKNGITNSTTKLLEIVDFLNGLRLHIFY